ncbi:hypothetical protein KJ644_00605 [Candidatus Dependentiae bacterium]|nr:hypothetical protein [Candidatus Dependentiae bacterium]MBU4386955.1 hypothetical protein [Candidatus Dependentiae bacterium]MCG2756525.1 hypothetical protein [Candidatus Dependentiae bacterium]
MINFKKIFFYFLIFISFIENISFAKSPENRNCVKIITAVSESNGITRLAQEQQPNDTAALDKFLEQFDNLDSNEFDPSEIQDDILNNLGKEPENSDNNNSDILSSNMDLVNFFKNPAAMADQFTDELKTEVMSTWQLSGNVMVRIFNLNPLFPIIGLLKDLKLVIQTEVFVSVADKIQEIILDQAFILKIQNNQLDDATKKELKNILESLENLLPDIKNKLKKDNLTKFNSLKEIVKLLSLGKFPEMFDALALYIKNENLRFKVAFKKVVSNLDKFIKSNKLDKEKVEAAIYWKDQIFEEFKPFVFAIDNKGNFDSTSFMLAQAGPVGVAANKILHGADDVAKFAPAILFSYGFYKKFLNYYLQDNKDNKKYLFKLLLGDSAISSLFFPVYLLKIISDVRTGKIDVANAFKKIQSDAFGFYLDPNFLVDKQNWFMRTFFRVGSAYVYSKYPNLVFTLLDDDKFNFNFPKNSTHMKSAVWFSIKDGYISFADYLEHQVYSKVDYKTLEAIENKTLGLISPKLIRFAVNTFAPIGVAKAFENNNLKKVANIDKNTVFGQEYIPLIDKEWQLSRYFFNPIGTGLDFLSGSDSIYYIGNTNYAKITDKEYWTNRCMGYVSVNIGSYIGKRIALGLKKQFNYILSRLALVLADALIHDVFDSNIKNILETEELIGKSEFKNLSKPDQKLFIMKSMVKDNVPYLFMKNDLPGGDQMQQYFFASLVKSGTFTELELAQFEKEFLNNEITDERLSFFSDRIMDSISSAIAKKFGEVFGGIAGRSLAERAFYKDGKNILLAQ